MRALLRVPSTMAIRDIFKVSRKTFINPSAWIDLDALKTQNQMVWGALKSLFSTPVPVREETFEQAVKRLGLTEDDIQTSISRYRTYALLFVGLALLVFIYAFFLLFYYGYLLAWLLAMAVCGLFLAQAFRFDFWAFQMRKRRLGITFNEWKQSILGQKGANE